MTGRRRDPLAEFIARRERVLPPLIPPTRRGPAHVTPSPHRTTSHHSGHADGTALAGYVAGRERVLGGRAVVPVDDPEAAADALAEALGGRQLARGYAARVLAALGPPAAGGGQRCGHPGCDTCAAAP